MHPLFCHNGPHVECEDRRGLQAPPIENVPDPYETALAANPACQSEYDEKTDQSDLPIVECASHVM